MLWGLGVPEWLTIIGLVGGLVVTFYVMARASMAYERKRRQRGAASAGPQSKREASASHDGETKEERT